MFLTSLAIALNTPYIWMKNAITTLCSFKKFNKELWQLRILCGVYVFWTQWLMVDRWWLSVTVESSAGMLLGTADCACKNNTLQWRHNERDGVSNHQSHDCLLNHLFRRRSKKTSKLRVTGLCVENSPVTGEFPTQRANNAKNVSIWWCHHVQ